MPLAPSLWIKFDLSAICILLTFHLWLHHDKRFALGRRIKAIFLKWSNRTSCINGIRDAIAWFQHAHQVPADGYPSRLREEKERVIVMHFQNALEMGSQSSLVIVLMCFLGSLLDQDFGVHDLVGCMLALLVYAICSAFTSFKLTVTSQRIHALYYMFMSLLLLHMCCLGEAVYWVALNSTVACGRICFGLLVLNFAKTLPFNCAMSLAVCCKSVHADFPSGLVPGFVLQELITLLGISVVLYTTENLLDEKIRATYNVSSSLRAVQKLLAVAFDADICLGADLRIVEPSRKAIHLLRGSSNPPSLTGNPPSEGGASTDINNSDFIRFVAESQRQSFHEFLLQQGRQGIAENAMLGPPGSIRLELQDLTGYRFDVDLFHVHAAIGSDQASHLLGIRECEPHKRVIPHAVNTSTIFSSHAVGGSGQYLSSLASSETWFSVPTREIISSGHASSSHAARPPQPMQTPAYVEPVDFHSLSHSSSSSKQSQSDFTEKVFPNAILMIDASTPGTPILQLDFPSGPSAIKLQEWMGDSYAAFQAWVQDAINAVSNEVVPKVECRNVELYPPWAPMLKFCVGRCSLTMVEDDPDSDDPEESTFATLSLRNISIKELNVNKQKLRRRVEGTPSQHNRAVLASVAENMHGSFVPGDAASI